MPVMLLQMVSTIFAVELPGFAILFLVELLVRVAIQRCTYFRSCWNWFDARKPRDGKIAGIMVNDWKDTKGYTKCPKPSAMATLFS